MGAAPACKDTSREGTAAAASGPMHVCATWTATSFGVSSFWSTDAKRLTDTLQLPPPLVEPPARLRPSDDKW
eukprot:CAMPEP_0114174656 /NCGR_PEP_ID=MMETSP0043_2-20121206/36520_1 /TAXON_ID=464988 /ORGANISM="Hemiselmis andersenii, Strain CCMP644" /LENGTH=71 /DNA_ID=CAMNT_0001272803 /DNA_START=26 /DNA_END=238 /DNA_ORIENTATION=-